ncbi:MAG: aminopeptidase [Oscillospiraceae bacterium]|nr:aminopeptidase [Oscillospiraceae bacterium]
MNKLEKYANLMLREGVNLQKGQPLLLTGYVENYDFVRLVTEQAYLAGASEVYVRWVDEVGARLRYLHGAEELFENYPEFQRLMFEHYNDRDACYLHIVASNPEALKGASPERLQKWNITSSKALKFHTDKTMSGAFAWCVAAAPNKEWAKKVFPELSEKEGMDKLWDAILQCSRVNNDDPISAWREHARVAAKRAEFLTNAQFRSLRFTNSIGSDFTLTLPDNHIWQGGSEKTLDGRTFSANIPTEEIFTAPHRLGTNGRVAASMPLVYQGDLIENIVLDFKDGRVVDYKASKNEALLKNLIETDEGSHYLGEVALVPHDSPISQLGILFYETLFDENASCHLAVGQAYPTCVKGAAELDDEKKKELGLNVSYEHADFMIGTPDLQIMGTKADGTNIQIFKDGNFAI